MRIFRNLLISLIFVLIVKNCYSQNSLKYKLSKQSVHIGIGGARYFLNSFQSVPITDPVGPSVTLLISKNKFTMLASLLFGDSKLENKSLLIDTIQINPGSQLKFRSGYLGFGHNVLNYKRTLLYPYLGATWSFIYFDELEESPIAFGVCGGLHIQFILNPNNNEGNFIYIYQNLRFDYIGLQNLNSEFSNIAFLPELGICFRFCPKLK